MGQLMIENKVPNSIDLSGVSSEFKERGSTNIIEADPYALFQQMFAGVSLQHAYFCNFTPKFPGPVDGQIVLAQAVPYTAVPSFIYDPFDAGDANPYRIKTVIPWVMAYDTVAKEYTFGSVSMKIGETNETQETAWIAPSAYGFSTSVLTNFTTALNAIHTVKLQTASNNIVVRAFGFFFDVEAAL